MTDINKWNISIDLGKNIAYNSILLILTDKKKVTMSDLENELIIRTSNIILYKNKIKTNIILFLIEHYGGLIQFIDTLEDIGILFINNQLFIIKINVNLCEDWYFV